MEMPTMIEGMDTSIMIQDMSTMLQEILKESLEQMVAGILDMLLSIAPQALFVVGLVIVLEFSKRFIDEVIGLAQARDSFITSKEGRKITDGGIWTTDFEGNAVFAPDEDDVSADDGDDYII